MMTYTPPFLPEARKDEGNSLAQRVARARKIREDAAARVERRYANIKPREGKWTTGDCHEFHMEPLSVL